MAFLQETPRSLRAYLLLVGVLGTVGQVYRVLASTGGAFERLLALIGLAISLAYVWVGISFRSLISAAPSRIEQVLIVGAAYSILLTVIVGVLSPQPEERGGALAQGLVGLLITLYLLRNVRRLAREAARPNTASTGKERLMP
jgi:hypothetical protein